MKTSTRLAERQQSTRPQPRARVARRMRVRGIPRWGSLRRTTPPAPSCRMTVGVRRANGTSASAIVVNLDMQRAEVIAPRLAVDVGEVVWLVLELGNGQPYTVVLTCSVSAVEYDRYGLSFIGLPEDESEAEHVPEGGSSVPDAEGSLGFYEGDAVAV